MTSSSDLVDNSLPLSLQVIFVRSRSLIVLIIINYFYYKVISLRFEFEKGLLKYFIINIYSFYFINIHN